MQVHGGYRLPCPEGCTKRVYELMLHCWEASPKARPTFTELALALQRVLSEVHAWEPATSVGEYLDVGADAESMAGTIHAKKGLKSLMRRVTGKTSRPSTVNPVYDCGDDLAAEAPARQASGRAAVAGAELYDMGDDGDLETDDDAAAAAAAVAETDVADAPFDYSDEHDM